MLFQQEPLDAEAPLRTTAWPGVRVVNGTMPDEGPEGQQNRHSDAGPLAPPQAASPQPPAPPPMDRCPKRDDSSSKPKHLAQPYRRMRLVQRLEPGVQVLGRYRLVRAIGKGGMGAVYEAVDTRLRNTVAVKQMTATGLPAALAFQREAEILASLRHPALPVVIDYLAETDEQLLVMQYIEGEDLARLMDRVGGPCDVDQVKTWARALLSALSYLHEHHSPIIHRDIKPANLKCTPKGEIVLLDFGLAKGGPDSSTGIGADERSLYGFTLKYAPIEQIEGRGTDQRSDIYALGATLYHLVTGEPPPSAPSRAAVVRAGQPDPIISARVLNPNVDELLSLVIAHALGIEPDDRFASAADMLAALGDALPVARPRPNPQSDPARRVDAAMPSQTTVGQSADLLVQVRFAHSPRLGLEDWPSSRRPSEIEQTSEPLRIEYPRHPTTGALLPARIRVRVIASNFRIDGGPDYLMDVPPDEYSKRLAVLLTPERPGPCRVNVEIYAPDGLHLGTVPVESEAVREGLGQPILRVANLVLNVFTRQRAQARTVDDGTDVPAMRPFEPARAARPQAVPISGYAPPTGSPVSPSVPPASRRIPRWVMGAAPVILVAAGALWFTREQPSRIIDIAGGRVASAPPVPAPQVVMPPDPPPAASAAPASPPAASAGAPLPGPVPPSAPQGVTPSGFPPAARGASPMPAAPASRRPSADSAREVLTQLEGAYRNLDAAAILSLWPTAPASATNFAGVRAYELAITGCVFSGSGDLAVATCQRTITTSSEAGQTTRESGRVRYRLARRTVNDGGVSETRWVIDAVEQF